MEIEEFNYADAMVNCKNQFKHKHGHGNGKLFEPRDSSTNTQVLESAYLISPSSFHIGINDRDSEGTFQYATGGDLVYTNWLRGYPKNGEPNDCAETWDITKWNDGSCYHRQTSICEMTEHSTRTEAEGKKYHNSPTQWKNPLLSKHLPFSLLAKN